METEMPEQISLKDAEQRAFATYYRDGMWDILVGYIVLVFALEPFLREPLGGSWNAADFFTLGESWSAAVFFPIGILLWLLLMVTRKYIVAPRAGRVTMSRARRKRMSWTFFTLFVVHFGAQIAGYDLLELAEDPDWATAVQFGILAFALFAIPAFLLKFRRLLVYGIMVAVSPLASELLYRQWDVVHHGYPVAFGTTGTIIIVTGVILFVRVLRSSPDLKIGAGPKDA